MRYTRQELKQDKFKETTEGAIHWTVEHRERLIVGGVLLVILAVIVIGGAWYYNYRNDQAAADLGAAMQIAGAPVVPKGAAPPQVLTYDTDQARAIAAKNAFYAVSSKYGSTRSGKIARYMAGLAEEQLNNNKVAEEDFKAVIDSRDSNAANLARFALASLYRDTNREADAINLYKELIAHPSESVPKTTAQMELAELYSTKQPDEAKKIYAEIQKDNPKGMIGELAAQHLAALK